MNVEQNITCLKCRFRHPAIRSCAEAKRLADQAAERRRTERLAEEAFIASEGSKPLKPMATRLQTNAQRAAMNGKAFAYARGLLINSEALGVGRAPFSHIDAETIAQHAWRAGYIAALRDARKRDVTP